MENLESICVACGTFLSYDVQQGKWAVIINRVGSAVANFNDSNILGPIQVNGTGLRDLYNSVTVEYPLRDTVDETDFVTVSIPALDRFANEPDNELKINMSMCNEPVQAQLLALIELKQSRIDQIVTFNTDYSMLSLNAGDIISVTNTLYGFSSALFRVITLKEVDSDDGSIQIEITALQYDANVYSTADLTRYIRSDRNGITGIGAIAQPIAPVLYVFNQDQRPGIQVEAVVPAGIIERMELWLSPDGSSYNWIQNFLAPPGGTLTPGDTVLFDYDSLDSQNIYVKVRGMNSTTAGPFSVADSFLSFVPQQITAAVNANTGVLSSGSNILTTVTLTTLLSALNSLIRDNSAGADGIYQKVFGVLQAETGSDLTSGPVFVAADVGTVNSTVVQSSNTNDEKPLGATTFTPIVSGTYKSDIVFDQNSSGARGGRGTGGGWGENLDYVAVVAELTVTSTGASVFVEASGGPGAQFWTDFLLTNLSSLTAGVSYTLTFTAINYTESNPSDTANFTVGWSVFSVG
jgi:hypothetical protein